MKAPVNYSAEIADRILSELRAGRPVHDICRDEGMPCADTVFEWIRVDREGFAAQYRQSREIGHGKAGYVGYSEEIVGRIIEELMGGRTLSEVCSSPDMPGLTSVNSWIATDRDGFATRYRAARVAGQSRQADVRYTPEIAGAVLAALRDGKALLDICADPDMPSATAVHNWVDEDRDGFAARYEKARNAGCVAMTEDMVRIADDRRGAWIVWRDEDGTVRRVLDPERTHRARLRIATRWKVVSRMLPQPSGAAPDGGGCSERELAEMKALINGRSRGLPGEDEPLDET